MKCPDAFPWGDGAWLARRGRHDLRSAPLNIYEVHLGSWRRGADGAPLSCGEIAAQLVPYVKQTGFTHVHLLPLARHAPEDSWGYCCTDPWTPDPRCGSPGELMALIDALHRAGVGVFLEWVCPPLPPEEAAACALHWLDEYHLDGLRPVCAPGCTEPPALEQLCAGISALRPGVCMMGYGASAETAFNWASPFVRADLSRPAIFALSHDETARVSLLERMDGDDAAKFAAVRALYTCLLALPAKTLTMMGCEFGQRGPWRSEHSLDWHLMQQPEGDLHRKLHAFFRAAGSCYLRTGALWQLDGSPEGFTPLWEQDGVYAFLRADRRGRRVLAAVNFSPERRDGLSLAVPRPYRYSPLFHTNQSEFGGDGRPPAAISRGGEAAVTLDLPPGSAALWACF